MWVDVAQSFGICWWLPCFLVIGYVTSCARTHRYYETQRLMPRPAICSLAAQVLWPNVGMSWFQSSRCSNLLHMTLQVFFSSNSAETDLRASVNLLSFKRVQVEYFAITSCKASRLKETEHQVWNFWGLTLNPERCSTMWEVTSHWVVLQMASYSKTSAKAWEESGAIDFHV